MNRNARSALAALMVGVLLALAACGRESVDEERSAELIQPVAQVAMAGAVATDASASAGAPRSGEQVYKLACASCHTAGLLNSPKTGDKAAWAPRIAQGLEVLYASSLNGKNNMPARGGNPALTDAEVKAAVNYLVKQAE